jgi:uncharacterized protein DUF5335
MTAVRTIPKPEWQSFFDSMADALTGKRVEIEAASLDLGDQIVAEWVPLLGISYDRRDDLVDVAIGGLDHLIRQPAEIFVQEGGHGVETITVATAGGEKQILRLKDPVMLPAAPRHR